VPQKDFQIWLTENVYLVIDYETDAGRVVGFVVRLMIDLDGSIYNVARYDTAHGTPHRDILTQSNNIIEKQWLIEMDFDSALTYAINDFKQNHENYIANWKAQ
jgi:hypothetical protein